MRGPTKKRRRFAGSQSSLMEKPSRSARSACSPNCVSVNSARVLSPSPPRIQTMDFQASSVRFWVSSQRMDSGRVKVPMNRIPPEINCRPTGICHSREEPAREVLSDTPCFNVSGRPFTRTVEAHIIDPVCDEDTPSIEPLVERAASASNLLGSHFGRVHGNHDTLTAHSQACDNTTDIPSRQRASVDDLNDYTDYKQSSRSNNADLPAIFIGERVDATSRDERAQLLQTNSQRRDSRLLSGRVLEVSFEGLVGEDTACDSGVIG